MPNPTQSPAETTPQVGETWATANPSYPTVVVLAIRGNCVEIENKMDTGEPRDMMHMSALLSRVSPAAAVSDRLFEGGEDVCCLCGDNRSWSRGRAKRLLVFGDEYKNPGASVCMGCWEQFGEKYDNCDAEITRRRSLAEPGFRLGDEVETTTSGYRGKITSVKASHHYGVDSCGQYHSTELRLIRRAPTEAARTGDARFYGKQPDVLPETLPAGTPTFWDIAGLTASEVRLNAARTYYDGTITWNNHLNTSAIPVSRIDWAKVPLPPATAGGERTLPPEVEHCSGCGVALGFGIHGKCNGCLNKSAGYPNVGFVPFDQRESGIDAAIRVSKLEQAKALLARPIRTGPLRDRDKYGQKVSLRGWETDDE